MSADRQPQLGKPDLREDPADSGWILADFPLSVAADQRWMSIFAERVAASNANAWTVTGESIRLDLADGGHVDHWLVTVDRGDVVVSRENTEADAVLRTDRSTFDGIVDGSVNTMAASLRGVLDVEGDPELVVMFRRMFPVH